MTSTSTRHPLSTQSREPLRVIGSMATKGLLAVLCAEAAKQLNCRVEPLAVGGVDAAKRVAADEAFDVVCLGAPAMAKLLASGHLRSEAQGVVRSRTVVATPTGAPAVDLSSAEALKAAVLAAPTVGLSTGPSGVALQALFTQWGIADTIRDRIQVPPPGTPVASLLASGAVSLGFQQEAELMGVAGVKVCGALPTEIAIDTVFAAAVATASKQPELAQALIAAWNQAANAPIKLQHGMQTL
jgi:molybdate transport system substrate-binding protein